LWRRSKRGLLLSRGSASGGRVHGCCDREQRRARLVRRGGGTQCGTIRVQNPAADKADRERLQSRTRTGPGSVKDYLLRDRSGHHVDSRHSCPERRRRLRREQQEFKPNLSRRPGWSRSDPRKFAGPRGDCARRGAKAGARVGDIAAARHHQSARDTIVWGSRPRPADQQRDRLARTGPPARRCCASGSRRATHGKRSPHRTGLARSLFQATENRRLLD